MQVPLRPLPVRTVQHSTHSTPVSLSLLPEARRAVAGVVGELVAALAAVLAGVGVGAAEGDLVLAELALVAGAAAALVLAHLVQAGGVVLAEVVHAVVHVQLAPHPGKAARTLAPAKQQLFFKLKDQHILKWTDDHSLNPNPSGIIDKIVPLSNKIESLAG